MWEEERERERERERESGRARRLRNELKRQGQLAACLSLSPLITQPIKISIIRDESTPHSCGFSTFGVPHLLDVTLLPWLPGGFQSTPLLRHIRGVDFGLTLPLQLRWGWNEQGIWKGVPGINLAFAVRVWSVTCDYIAFSLSLSFSASLSVLYNWCATLFLYPTRYHHPPQFAYSWLFLMHNRRRAGQANRKH